VGPLDQLIAFGVIWGLALQCGSIDILDFTGSESQLGKHAANDLAAGYRHRPALLPSKAGPALTG